MRVFMLLAKLMMLAFWLTVILSLLGVIEVPNPQRLHLIALIVLGVHVVECLLMYRKLKKLGSTGLHLLQVMVFGVLHLRHPDTVRAINQALQVALVITLESSAMACMTGGGKTEPPASSAA